MGRYILFPVRLTFGGQLLLLALTESLAAVAASGTKDRRLRTKPEFVPIPSAQPWIYGPWLDVIVGCGAWSAPLLLLATIAGASNGHAWGVAFYLLAVAFNYPHFMATVYRAYHTREDFAKYRIFTLHFTVLLALTAILAHYSFRLVPWIFTLYICWSPWHYAGQNFGLLMMFLRRRGATVTAGERRLLRLAFIASYAMLMVSFHTGPSHDPLILSLGLPFKIALPAELILGAAFAALGAFAFARLIRGSGFPALLAPLILLFSQFLWFVLPTLLNLVSGLQIPQTRYSSGILAVLHSTQYLWITSYYAQREAKASGATTWRMSTYFATLITGGIALFICGPWLVSYIFQFDFTVSFLIFTALVNIHHFILDGAIWKLRDTRIAALLIDQGVRAPTATSGTGSTVIAATRWLGGKSPAARTVRVGLAIVLLLWGALDQVHYVFVTDESNLVSLLRPASLNPYDSSLQMRIARVELREGNLDKALGALTRAVAANPKNPIPQQALGRALIENSHWSEAYEHYQEMLVLFPRDPGALVTFGILAQQQGHNGEAIGAWEKAVQIDPSQMNAHLYLAEALDRKGQPAAAVPHYEAFLQMTAAQSKERSGTPGQNISVRVKLADDLSQTNQPTPAFEAYASALALAEQVGDRPLQSLVLAHLADLQDKTGEIAAAAQSYQRGLALDQVLADRKAEAFDWFNYGQFLRRRGQSKELSFACFLQAENLLESAPGQELETARKVREQTEGSLGGKALVVRKDLAGFLAKAMSLTPFVGVAR